MTFWVKRLLDPIDSKIITSTEFTYICQVFLHTVYNYSL